MARLLVANRDPAALPGLLLPNFSSGRSCSAEAEQELFESAPECDPAGFTITFSHQESTESSEMSKEVPNGVNRTSANGAEHVQPRFGNNVLGRKLRLPPSDRFHLQQADSQHAQHAGYRFQPCSRLVQPGFQPGPTHQNLVRSTGLMISSGNSGGENGRWDASGRLRQTGEAGHGRRKRSCRRDSEIFRGCA